MTDATKHDNSTVAFFDNLRTVTQWEPPRYPSVEELAWLPLFEQSSEQGKRNVALAWIYALVNSAHGSTEAKYDSIHDSLNAQWQMTRAIQPVVDKAWLKLPELAHEAKVVYQVLFDALNDERQSEVRRALWFGDTNARLQTLLDFGHSEESQRYSFDLLCDNNAMQHVIWDVARLPGATQQHHAEAAWLTSCFGRPSPRRHMYNDPERLAWMNLGLSLNLKNLRHLEQTGANLAYPIDESALQDAVTVLHTVSPETTLYVLERLFAEAYEDFDGLCYDALRKWVPSYCEAFNAAQAFGLASVEACGYARSWFGLTQPTTVLPSMS